MISIYRIHKKLTHKMLDIRVELDDKGNVFSAPSAYREWVGKPASELGQAIRGEYGTIKQKLVAKYTPPTTFEGWKAHYKKHRRLVNV